MRVRPGKLLRQTLDKMKEYLSQRRASGEEIDDLCPLVMSYLTSVLIPSATGQMSVRNERELRTLAMALDSIITGDSTRAADILIQRFKAVETAHADGHWSMSRHLEALPEGRVGSLSISERERIIKAEANEIKLKALAGKRRPE